MWPPFFGGVIPTYGILLYAMIVETCSRLKELYKQLVITGEASVQLEEVHWNVFCWCLLLRQASLYTYGFVSKHMHGEGYKLDSLSVRAALSGKEQNDKWQWNMF